MKVNFLKLHGLGNDFILIDETGNEVIPENLKGEFSARKCDRHTGIGADGTLFLGDSREGVEFRIFNSDGSEAEMCVNGLRCAALALSLRLGQDGDVVLNTRAGPVDARVIEMTGDIEGIVELSTRMDPEYLGEMEVKAGGRKLLYHIVDVGNPHAVTFLDEDLESFDVEGVGHAMQDHVAFQPRGTNTEFVRIEGPGRLTMRVHERGACETQACGSGAIAAATASQTLYPETRRWSVRMPGGSLEIEVGDRTKVTGPATLAFEGSTYF